jgi:diacylglycerol kinase (ATP)
VDRPFCLIVNPAAGNGRAHGLLPPARKVLDAAGAEHLVMESASLAHARDLATKAAARGDVVVAVGGDGMAGALAGVAAASRARYGLIPAGRGNDLASVLGIPSDPAAAAKVLAGGRVKQIDLISVSSPGQPDVVVAGSVYAGIPAVAGEIANATRWLRGPLVYPVAALRALARWQPAIFTVTCSGGSSTEVETAGGSGGSSPRVDADEFDGYAVVVANSAFFGAGMHVAPSALIDDGLLDVVLMRRAARLTFVRALTKIKNGSHIGMPQISLRRGAAVTMTMSRDLPAGADGEPLPGATPLVAGAALRIRALPSALSVLVP